MSVEDGPAEKRKRIQWVLRLGIAYFKVQVWATGTACISTQSYLLTFFYDQQTRFGVKLHPVTFLLVLLFFHKIGNRAGKTVQVRINAGMSAGMVDVECQPISSRGNTYARNIAVFDGHNRFVYRLLCFEINA
ncbi:hypothetical protein SDC9_65625 [bioreactor metagenome]|uniref:Uncharacterized protein n=1 Tax=bioreactor metagenome TaxID=1076179 RepID=A0A644XTH3_9ZZZZ